MLQAGRLGGLQGLARRLGGAGPQGRRDAGDVEPLRAGEHLGPGDHARPDGGDGRPLAVVQHAAGPRGGAEFEEVDADAVVVVQTTWSVLTPASRAWLAISRPSGLSVRRDTQAADRPSRARPTAVFSSAPPTCTSRLCGLLQAAEVRAG